MEKVYIIAACRTPIGKMGGTLSSVPAAELGACVIKEAVKRASLQPEDIDHVYMGCVIQAGLGQNVARQSAIRAGLRYETTAETINAVCGSGLECVNHAARLIELGEANIVIAGGTENMSMAPYALKEARYGYRLGNATLIDTMVNDALWDAFNDCHMGITAENICQKWGISRKELDTYAAQSQKKAHHAIETGMFMDEIVPVTVNSKKGSIVFHTDESPRLDVTADSLARLKPAFKSDGMVTAGNSSGINDGAAALVLMSEKKVREMGISPMARWCGGYMAGVDPAIMGIGPVASTQKLLEKLHLTIDNIDLIEANEAFAAQSIAVARELNIPDSKLNVNGGAIALGHPVGASGSRILVTLLYAMKARKARLGLATLCIGGGMGCSIVVSKEDIEL